MADLSTGYIGPMAAGFAVWVLVGTVVVFRRYAGHRDGVGLSHLVLLVLAPWQLVSDRRRAMASQAAAVAAYDDEVGAHRVRIAAWRRRRSELSRLLEIAQRAGAEGGEAVYCTVPASLVEGERSPQPGTLTVTSGRLLFDGEVRREWDTGQVEQVRHVGEDRTLLRPAGNGGWSALRYHAPVVRNYLELALATCPRSRASLLTTLARNLEGLEIRDPRPPVPPAPAPGLPRRQRRRAQRWRADRSAEIEPMSLDRERVLVPPQPVASRETAFTTAA